MEVWKPVVGYEGLYEVSNLGRIKSLKKGLILKPCIRDKKHNYLFVNLYNNGNMRGCNIHRIVATAFIQNDNINLEVNHIDGDKTNNKVENLEWTTHRENMKHACKTGLINSYTHSNNRKFTKLTFDDINSIRELYKNKINSKKELSEKYHVTINYIYKILSYEVRINC